MNGELETVRALVRAALASLEASRQRIDDLNVYPVPDGDTGTNLTLTARAVVEALERSEARDRTALAREVTRAALMGARGNSGVILSQIVRGAAEELATRPGELIDPVLVSAAFARAADAAYESVRSPAEGTMLTVVRAMAMAAAQHLARLDEENRRIEVGFDPDRQDELLAGVLEAITLAGEEAVRRTPGQLDVLADAGVVDAGAHGLVLILAGIVAGLRGDETPKVEIPEQAPARISAPQHTDSRYRYCVNFVVLGEDLEAEEFEAPLRGIGDSVLVVGDRRTLRVHVHTDEPGRAREVFDGHGTVQGVDEADMREQMAARAARLDGQGRCAVVAVASGAGLRALFESLGAGVVDGGPTMNPSTDDLLAGIHAADAESVLVLPNSPNVVLAAEHAAELSERDARVIDCTSQQAGLAALVEVDVAAAADENVDRLTEALAEIQVGALAQAARDDVEGRFLRGDAVGFVDGEIVAWGGTGSTLAATLAALGAGAEIVTIIEGEGAPMPLEHVAALAPDGVETELHRGDQPSYWWLLAAQ